MAHFEIEEIEPSPEEKALQEAKQKEVEQKEREAAAKTIKKEENIEKVLETEDRSGTFNIKTEKPSQTQVQQPLFYPLVQALNDYITRNQLQIEPANDNEREALMQATAEVEAKYGMQKINSPEARLAVAMVTPIARQFDKVLARLQSLRRAKASPQNAPETHSEEKPPETPPLPAGFKTNVVQKQ
ncbi:MAG: hypothetical protein QXH07_01840 [Thermoplasmata archaeon]